MTLTSAELNQDPTARWFCLKTHPKQEHLAAAALRQIQQIKCFAPRIRFRKSTRRGVVWFVEPLFPGYLFANFSYTLSHRQVEHAPRVSGIVKFGDRVAVIGDRFIDQLQGTVGPEETIIFDPEPGLGERIKIGEGAFQGLEAVVTQLVPAKDRVKVLIDFLGRPVEAEVAVTTVVPARNPAANSFERRAGDGQ